MRRKEYKNNDCSVFNNYNKWSFLEMLPNLSLLNFSTDAKTKLFDHVAQRGGGKNECVVHSEDYSKEKNNKADYNCAIDGYLMYRSIEGAAAPSDYSGKEITVQVEGVPVALQPLLSRARAAADRKSDFERRHVDWIRNTFPLVCERGTGLEPVTWDDYGKELAKITEWYILDEAQKRGHLFLQLFDTLGYKQRMHMPADGVFAGRYMYIALVCAAGGVGYGKYLMKVAEAACRVLGCEGIALASLSNSAGFYYSLGFKFVSNVGGQELDVSAWTELVEQPDGSVKTRLVPNREADPYEDPRTSMRDDASATLPARTSKRERDAGEQPKGEEEEERWFVRALKAARSWYTWPTALSFVN